MNYGENLILLFPYSCCRYGFEKRLSHEKVVVVYAYIEIDNREAKRKENEGGRGSDRDRQR